jgi:anti-anti-sigma factor
MSFETQPELVQGVRLVRVSGELDITSVDSFLADLPTSAGTPAPLVLDLSQVTFFDSAAVRLVDRLARDLGGRGHGFCVLAPPGCRARRVLELVGLSEGLVTDDRASAVQRVSPPQ